MSYVQVWIHAIWGTKNRQHLLRREIRPTVMKPIRENAREKDLHIDSLDGSTEHLHCLFALNADMPIAKALQLIKGESAYWINKEKLTLTRFEWANEYYAASVSESMLPLVRRYIENQEPHHMYKKYADEVQGFLANHDLALHDCGVGAPPADERGKGGGDRKH